MVVALVALAVGLGGSAYAANKITSSQIANNGVRSADIRNNDVRSKDIRNNDVRGKDIRNNQVESKDIRDNDVQGSDLRDGGVAGADVAADTLTGSHILESSLGTVPGASTLGGSPPGAFAAAPIWALVNKNGSIVRQSGGISATLNGGSTLFIVTFPQSVAGRGISATRAFTSTDSGNSIGVEVGLCGTGLDCTAFALPNDGTTALVVTTGIDSGPPASVSNEAHAFWLVAQ